MLWHIGISLGLARTVYIYTVYDRIFGDFPAKVTVHTPYIYGSGHPYISHIMYYATDTLDENE